jgi:predicted enzyme related to lactoylglutathione lyase
MSEPGKVGNVFYPVSDVDAAAKFYAGVFSFGTKFQDGDRYAALDGGSVTFALAGAEEDVTGGRVAASIKVADVNAAVASALSAGGTVAKEPEVGPHEIRAVLVDPWGNHVVVYSSLPK